MKYKLGEKHPTYELYRVVYLRDIPRYGVKSGDVGGWIASKHNLSQDGDCVVLDEAVVYGYAKIYDHANIRGNAMIFDYANIANDAQISDNARIFGNASIYGNATINAHMHISSGYHGVTPTLINRLRSIAK